MNSRRRFLRQSLIAVGACASWPIVRAVEPFRRTGEPRFLLSLAAYSFRKFFGEGASGRRIDLFDFIDFCAENGCAGTELTSYYFPKSIDREYLLKIRRHAFLRGIPISGTAVGNTFTLPPGDRRDQEIASVKRWVDYAQIMGAPHIRIFAGSAGSASNEEAKELCVAALQECCDYAGQKGIMLGLENHGGIVAQAEDLLDLVRAVESPWLGVNLDTGNFHSRDPYADLAKCAPYAVNVQVKAEMSPQGGGRQAADFGRIMRILRDAQYQGYVALEYESSEDPWTAVPRLLKALQAEF